MARHVQITTLRTLDCPDRFACPGLHRVADRPGRVYIVTTTVTDAVELAAFADHVGEGEQLGWVPDELIPEV